MKHVTKFYVAIISFAISLTVSLQSLAKPLFTCIDANQNEYTVSVVSKSEHLVNITSENKSFEATGKLIGVVQLNSGYFKMLSTNGQTIFLIGTDSASSHLSGFLNTNTDTVEISCRNN